MIAMSPSIMLKGAVKFSMKKMSASEKVCDRRQGRFETVITIDCYGIGATGDLGGNYTMSSELTLQDPPVGKNRKRVIELGINSPYRSCKEIYSMCILARSQIWAHPRLVEFV